MSTLLSHLLRDNAGTMIIETAIVAPVLAVMAIGVVEVGTMVSKQQELQSGANEAEAIILAASAGSGVDSAKLKNMLSASTGVSAENISLVDKYRCGNDSVFVSSASSCPAGQRAYQFVQATFSGSYTPVWAQFGFAQPFTYTVTRTVQVG